MFTNMKYYILLQECYLKFTVSQVNLPVFSIQFFFPLYLYLSTEGLHHKFDANRSPCLGVH